MQVKTINTEELGHKETVEVMQGDVQAVYICPETKEVIIVGKDNTLSIKQ